MPESSRSTYRRTPPAHQPTVAQWKFQLEPCSSGGELAKAGADIDALEQLILQVSAFAWEHREVAELDLNPVIARPDGVLAVDARVVLAAEE